MECSGVVLFKLSETNDNIANEKCLSSTSLGLLGCGIQPTWDLNACSVDTNAMFSLYGSASLDSFCGAKKFFLIYFPP